MRALIAIFSCIILTAPLYAQSWEDNLRWQEFGPQWAAVGIACSPDGRYIASSGLDTNVSIRDAVDGSVLHTLKTEINLIDDLSFSPDGALLASGDAPAVYVWDVESGEEVVRIESGFGVGPVSFAPGGGRLLFADRLSNNQWVVRVWDVEERRVIDSALGGVHSSKIYKFSWSADGRTLAAGNQDSVLIWDMPAGELRAEWKAPDWCPSTISLSPNGETIAVGCYVGAIIGRFNPRNSPPNLQKIYIVRTDNGENINVINNPGGSSGYFFLKFLPGGESLLSCGWDLQLWDPQTGEELYSNPTPPTPPNDSYFYRFYNCSSTRDGGSVAFGLSCFCGDVSNILGLMHIQLPATTVVPKPAVADFANLPVYPNPLLPGETMIIPLQIGSPGEYRLDLYTLAGKRIARIFEGYLETGERIASLNTGGLSLSAGLYVVRLTHKERSIGSMMILR